MWETQVGTVLSYMKHKRSLPRLLSGLRGKQSMCSSPEAAAMSFVISPVGFPGRGRQLSKCCFHSFDDGQMKQ